MNRDSEAPRDKDEERVWIENAQRRRHEDKVRRMERKARRETRKQR